MILPRLLADKGLFPFTPMRRPPHLSPCAQNPRLPTCSQSRCVTWEGQAVRQAALQEACGSCTGSQQLVQEHPLPASGCIHGHLVHSGSACRVPPPKKNSVSLCILHRSDSTMVESSSTTRRLLSQSISAMSRSLPPKTPPLEPSTVLHQDSPWRSIHDQVVDLSPVDILQKLLDEAILAGAPPDDCIIWVLEHEACNRCHCEM